MPEKLHKRAKNFVMNEVLHANDSPHRLALGIAVGMFVAFTPTKPFQMALTVFLSWLVRANKLVGVPCVWITNPAVMLIFYIPQYILGCWVIGVAPENVNFEVLVDTHLPFSEYAANAWTLMLEVFWPLWIGSLLVSISISLSSYYLSRIAIIKYRDSRAITS